MDVFQDEINRNKLAKIIEENVYVPEQAFNMEGKKASWPAQYLRIGSESASNVKLKSICEKKTFESKVYFFTRQFIKPS